MHDFEIFEKERATLINTFIQQAHIKLIKSDSKDISNVIKIKYFKLMLFNDLSIHQRILKNVSQLTQKY